MLTVVTKGSFAFIKAMIQKANKKVEAIEFRLDLFDNLAHVSKLKSACSLPVIFTLRKVSQGGKFAGNEQEREAKLLELLTLKPDYIDLEYDCNLDFVEAVQKNFPDVSIISSYHDFEKTPDPLIAVLDEMKRFPATIYKIATYAKSSLDSLRMLVFIRDMRQQGVSLAGMCMGKKGGITRILAPVVDSLITYAPLASEGETAQGQLTVDTLEMVYYFSHLNRQTTIYALIGDPVDKSISHFAYNYIFHKLKHDAVYVKITIKPKEVAAFFHLMKQLPFRGFSVTMPLKEQVAPYLDTLDFKAKTIGAINTLVCRNGKWEGFNTDASGALDAVETKGTIFGKKLVILGAGGTAKALAFEAMQRGGEVLIVNRTKDKAQKLAYQLDCEGISIEEWQSPTYDILMNTTSVGMAPQDQKSPIPEEAIQSQATIFDVIFNPKETYLLNLAQNKGCQIIYGYEMFARQGVKQLELWFNQELDQEDLLQDIARIYHKTISS